jgi:hypothetical protein
MISTIEYKFAFVTLFVSVSRGLEVSEGEADGGEADGEEVEDDMIDA